MACWRSICRCFGRPPACTVQLVRCDCMSSAGPSECAGLCRQHQHPQAMRCRWLKAAALAEGKDRLDFLTMHVVEVWHPLGSESHLTRGSGP